MSGEAASFFICDLRSKWRRQKYVTFWRPENANYAWPLEWSGEYDRTTVDASASYYFERDEERLRFPVPVAMARHLARSAEIDSRAVHCVPNTKRNRELLRAAAYIPTPLKSESGNDHG